MVCVDGTVKKGCEITPQSPAVTAPLKGSLEKKPPLKGEGDRRRRWRGSCEIFCLMCEMSRKYPSVTCGASSLFKGAYIPKGEPECKKPPLKGEGDRRRRWRGSCEIFCLMCEMSRKYPSVTCGASSLFKGAYIPKGEPECKKPPLKGEGDRRRRWRGSVKSFAWCKRSTR